MNSGKSKSEKAVNESGSQCLVALEDKEYGVVRAAHRWLHVVYLVLECFHGPPLSNLRRRPISFVCWLSPRRFLFGIKTPRLCRVLWRTSHFTCSAGAPCSGRQGERGADVACIVVECSCYTRENAVDVLVCLVCIGRYLQVISL